MIYVDNRLNCMYIKPIDVFFRGFLMTECNHKSNRTVIIADLLNEGIFGIIIELIFMDPVV